jgi:carbon-monoxide dehydrogenase medium subunit
MYAFEYQKVTTVADAAAKLAANADAKLLAGGQSMIASMKLRLANPALVVDLGTVPELRGIKADAGGVTIGAMARHAEVAASAEVQKAIPALAALAGGIGDRMVRNMGTLGGAVANSDPAAD